MKMYYTTVGIFKLKRRDKNNTYPMVILGGKECQLDVQEMMIWSSLNWRILNAAQLRAYYEEMEKNTDFICSRSYEDALKRLITRGLVSVGIGESDEDALYNLISKLYIVPLYQSAFVRVISFLRLALCFNVPYEKAKVLFQRDRKTKTEKRIMELAFSAPMSTAEMIKCVDKDIDFIISEDDVVEFLYDDENVTSDTIADVSRKLPSAREVMIAISNLYLRRQILFERI